MSWPMLNINIKKRLKTSFQYLKTSQNNKMSLIKSTGGNDQLLMDGFLYAIEID